MNVRQNIAYGLKLRKLAPRDIDERVSRALSLVRMESLSERMSSELSGGQQQRVAVARALVMEPPVLLLDEPFAALDLKLRQAMQDELRRIHRAVGGTFVFVTHDQTEALALANRIAVMNEGRIEQIGTPEEMYLSPASRFVAQFIGEANILAGVRRGNHVQLGCGLTFFDAGPEQEIILVMRPEHARLATKPLANESSVAGEIEEMTFFGSHVRYTVKLSSGERLRMHAPVTGDSAAVGDRITVAWPRSAERVLPA
jgi:ABC-type Fe3+/spermidine/putrescine transport system ATPase subunit